MKLNTIAFLTFTLLNLNSFAQTTLISDFKFNNNLIDEKGNGLISTYNIQENSYDQGIFNWKSDTLSKNGGGLIYTIPQQLFDHNLFSILVTFKFEETQGYKKLIDFSGSLLDEGIYVNRQIRMYPSSEYVDSMILPDQFYTILLSKDSAQDTAYIHLVKNNQLIKLAGINGLKFRYNVKLRNNKREIRFFHDDSSTLSEFSPSGSVDQITIWNGIAGLNDINQLKLKPINKLNQIKIYPQPASETIELESNITINEIQIYNTQGQLVYSIISNYSPLYNIDVSNLKSGLYYMHINRQFSQKLIIDNN